MLYEYDKCYMNTINVNGVEVPVSQFRNDWAIALMQQGVIVKLTLSWWRARAPLKAEELGIPVIDEAKFKELLAGKG